MVIAGHMVKTSQEVKYLGVVLDNKLSFKAYVARRTVVGWGVARFIRNLLTKIELRTEAVVKIIKIVLVPSLVYRFKV
jgi:sporulation protein YlmC with PRC-barrel domain